MQPKEHTPWLKIGSHVDLCHMVTVLQHMVIYILTPNRNLMFWKNNLL